MGTAKQDTKYRAKLVWTKTYANNLINVLRAGHERPFTWWAFILAGVWDRGWESGYRAALKVGQIKREQE